MARRFLVALIAAYWLVTTPVGAALLVAPLSHGFGRIDDAAQAAGVDTVVVLGGGGYTLSVGDIESSVPANPTVLRTLEGIRVFRKIDARLLIVSAGQPDPRRLHEPESALMRRTAIEAGVPTDRIVLETTSKNTHEQAQALVPILRAHHVDRFVLVTSPTHMRRSIGAFRHEGLRPIPSIAPIRSDTAQPASFFAPNFDSLAESDLAIYDYAALTYYWSRGWLSPRNPSQD